MDHVIIGAGPAGITAAETLRQNDPEGRILVVGDEPEPPYSRMAIPYLLSRHIEESGTWLRDPAHHYAERGIEIQRARVERLDAQAHRLHLDDGSSRSYDRLLVASGSHPAVPPIPGVDLPGVHACWTLADARALMQRTDADSDVVLIGAGFIGCIILEALRARGVRLVVVEQGERMVPRMMNDKAGGLIRAWCERKGIRVHTGTGVDAIEANGDRLAVRLTDGTVLPAATVIAATGVRPNTAFLQGSGVNVANGIVVDQHMQSSVTDVYAAGDVAEGVDFSSGGNSVQAVQPTAVDHGRIAALNMAGRDAAFVGGLNMNVLDTLGLISSSFGLWMGVAGGEKAELYAPDDFRYVNLQFEEDRLIGASAVGLTEHVGVLRGLIQGRQRLGVWRQRLMADPTRIMEAYLATFQ